MTSYEKYCYGLDSNRFTSVKNVLEEKENQGTDETHLPCRVLRSSMELGYVASSSWNGFHYKDDFMTWLADAFVVKSSDLSVLKKTVKELLRKNGEEKDS